MPQGREGSKDDLKAREYRDAKGQIHHHTHPYMERHGMDDGAKPKAKSRAGGGSTAGKAKGDGLSVEMSRSARATTDPGEIRSWAEAHGGVPAAVKRTHKGGDVGIIRIMFPDAPNSEHDALQEITWDEFFQELDARDLALLYDEDSMFSKIIGRDTVEKRQRGDHDAAR